RHPGSDLATAEREERERGSLRGAEARTDDPLRADGGRGPAPRINARREDAQRSQNQSEGSDFAPVRSPVHSARSSVRQVHSINESPAIVLRSMISPEEIIF